jgi:hypothetical protein
MDSRLERLKNSLLNSWFPTQITLFENEDATEPGEIIELFFEDLLERYRTAFPALGGRVYLNFEQTEPLFLQDIDKDILRILGVTTTNPQTVDRLSCLSCVTGRDTTYVDPQLTSPYMSEQAALDLYAHITVDEWSGRMDDPLIMWDDQLEQEYILPSLGDFIILYIKERPISIDNIPSSLYPSVEAFLLYNLASYVLSALGRFPLSLALDDINTEETGTGQLDPDDISSITINGKLTLSMASSSTDDYEKLSDLFSSGSGLQYTDQLSSVHNNYKKIFEVLKYTRLGGVSVI